MSFSEFGDIARLWDIYKDSECKVVFVDGDTYSNYKYDIKMEKGSHLIGFINKLTNLRIVRSVSDVNKILIG